MQRFNIEALIKVRGSLDEIEQTYLTWQGSLYARIPQQKPKQLFKIIGMSVSRCLPVDEGVWDFTSRELTLYLDPETGEVLRQWENPWTGEVVPVMHVANNPVQFQLRGQFPAQIYDDTAIFAFNLFPRYPNPLADDPKLKPYSPFEIYESAELFKFAVPAAELNNPEVNSVSKLTLGWDRIGQWLPWMKMGDSDGEMLYSACGGKVPSFDALPELLQQEINERVPVYKNAPQSFQEEEDMTSWLYFQRHFDAYLARKTFPIPEKG
jgi:hypothetical protein